MLRAAVAHDTVAADRLRREAAALGLAWHPNVVEVFEDGYLPDGTCYLVMERLHGESLAMRLRRVGAMTPEELMPIALQLCDALGAVHAAGIVHRDVKPSNIFLAQEPGSNALRVKVLDFGIARVEWAETRLTNANAPLGTPGYMSPEQEQGEEIDQRTDLFGMGVVIYECLTGFAPPLKPSELWERARIRNENESGVQRALAHDPGRFSRRHREGHGAAAARSLCRCAGAARRAAHAQQFGTSDTERRAEAARVSDLLRSGAGFEHDVGLSPSASVVRTRNSAATSRATRCSTLRANALCSNGTSSAVPRAKSSTIAVGRRANNQARGMRLEVCPPGKNATSGSVTPAKSMTSASLAAPTQPTSSAAMRASWARTGRARAIS